MTDVTRVAPEVETPVNPYSLVEAVNSSSETAHTGWMIFIGVMTYLMIAVAGVTHKALLLETPLELPILQVELPITQFFQFAPIVLVLFHLGLVAQLVLLARKTLEFDQAIRLLESTDRRTHPLRLELHNFFFVQAIAGPHRSLVMGSFLHAMSWLTLVILPVVLILYIQVVFLPYHDELVTWTHRIALLFDILVLILIGVFLMRAETNFFQALWRTTKSHPVSFMLTGCVLAVVALFSLTVATVPGEWLDRKFQQFYGRADDVATRGQGYYASFVFPFIEARADGSLFGFHRNLVVTDTDMVSDKDVTGLEPTVNLRGRDLRFARLDRSDLHQADFTGADLSHASLAGTDLRNALMHCSSLDDLVLDRRQNARCVTAKRVNLKRARLTGARMTGIDLYGADLEEADLVGANLAYSVLTATNFTSARLEKADLTGGIQAQTANFLVATLQGADLTGAQLQFADFSSASLQGALLSHAHLQGAILRDADLEAADLFASKLHAADMTGAKIRAGDLRFAGIWKTLPPAENTTALSDLTSIKIRPVDSEDEIATLKRAIERVEPGPRREQLKVALQPIMQNDGADSWQGSTDQLRWESLVQVSDTSITEEFPQQITDFLSSLGCRARWSNGSVATGVARRAQTQQFRGSLVEISDRLTSSSCPAGTKVPLRILQSLTQTADVQRGN